MNNEKHVTPDEVSTSANLLPKYLVGKSKNEYISGFYLNLPAGLFWLNIFDTNGYLHRSLQTRHNLLSDMSDLGRIYPTLIRRF
jgi:hypothetical protein